MFSCSNVFLFAFRGSLMQNMFVCLCISIHTMKCYENIMLLLMNAYMDVCTSVLYAAYYKTRYL